MFALTPLLLAALQGQEAIVDILMGVGADQNVRDNQGHALLHLATYG